MQISVALDGSKQRNLSFFAGDEQQLDVVVYAKDGDTDAIAATDARILTHGYPATTIPVGAEFVVPQNCYGRRAYRLVAEIAGITTTLAYGVMTTLGGGCCYGWDYGTPSGGDYDYAAFLLCMADE